MDRVRVQTKDFSIVEESQWLANEKQDGAIVTFVGKVRDFNNNSQVKSLTLEHYPGMTETVLNDLISEARERWSLNLVTVIHRVGCLALGEQIVFIGVSSGHRKAAFAACEFLIDALKSRAPFWKREQSNEGDLWLKAVDADEQLSKGG